MIDLTKEELVQIIRETVKSEMSNYKHTCRFSMTDAQATDIGRYVNVISRMGDGDFDEGIEIVKDNHKWLREMRDKGNKFQNAFTVALITGCAGALLVVLWEGLKAKLFK